MRTEIRPARPGDAAFLSWVILTAGRAHVKRGIWEVVLGEPETACLAFLKRLAVTVKPHLFHHACYLIAEADGNPAAGLGGYDPRVMGYDALRLALQEVMKERGDIALREKEMNRRAARVLGCIPDDVQGAWIIDSVATLPEFRRKGIVSGLLEEIMEKGRRLGFRCAQINMYIGNTQAQRAYEKHGFQILDEKRDPDFEAEIGSPGMVRMARTL
ncbi:MAG: GNAT family N-acetyltransferase [Deltaproteobacteria bacterium]|nr:GNAT family N-acetyltransferase [Deltaproteobacteria bacterium]